MARLIDADQAVAEAERLLELYNLAMAGAETNREINHIFKRQELFKAVRAVVNTCPTNDPVKHGRWVVYPTLVSFLRCSQCRNGVGWNDDKKPNYCPNCGAKMDGNQNGN